MEVKVYEVSLEIYCEHTDMDSCTYWGWATRREDTCATKRAAISVCQSWFAKQPLNRYVPSVHADVCEITITDKGRTGRKRIYNKFKKK